MSAVGALTAMLLTLSSAQLFGTQLWLKWRFFQGFHKIHILHQPQLKGRLLREPCYEISRDVFLLSNS